eukprot:tig00000553_g2092.t1
MDFVPQTTDADDADEELIAREKEYPAPRWQAHAGAPAPSGVRTLVVGIRGLGACALHAALSGLHLELRADIVIPDQQPPAHTGVVPRMARETCCAVCASPEVPEALFVFAQGPVPEERAGAWARLLLEHTGAERVLVLDGIAEGQYRCEDRDAAQPPLLRHLASSKHYEGELARAGLAPLEPPNCAERATAALLQRCEASGRACAAVLSLQDRTGPGAASAGALLAPLRALLPALPAPKPGALATALAGLGPVSSPVYL